MKNFIQNGDYLEFTAAADITSGQLVAVGSLVGVAMGAVANGQKGTLAMRGVFDLPKSTAASSAIAPGAPVYRIGASSLVTAVSSGNTLCGYATPDSNANTDGATVARVKLLG
jgi:predicted RecA/RadA family phage recombinase